VPEHRRQRGVAVAVALAAAALGARAGAAGRAAGSVAGRAGGGGRGVARAKEQLLQRPLLLRRLIALLALVGLPRGRGLRG
jgi:hypothetical protein